MAKVGQKVRIIEMKDEPRYTGREGIITHIANAVPSVGFKEQWYGSWGGIAIQPDNDNVEVIA